MDKMEITIEEDGTISINVDEISPTKHVSAEKFLADLQQLMGGEVKVTKLPHTHSHARTGQKVGH